MIKFQVVIYQEKHWNNKRFFIQGFNKMYKRIHKSIISNNPSDQLNQYIKQKILLIKLAISILPLPFKVSKNKYLNNNLFMINKSRVKYYVVLEKLIVHNKAYLDYCSHGKKN